MRRLLARYFFSLFTVHCSQVIWESLFTVHSSQVIGESVFTVPKLLGNRCSLLTSFGESLFTVNFFKLGNDICHLPAGGSAPVGASGPLQAGQCDVMPSFYYFLKLAAASRSDSHLSLWRWLRPPLATMSMGDRNAQPAGQVYIRTFAAGSTFRSPMLMAATPPSRPARKVEMSVLAAGGWRFFLIYIFQIR